MERPRYSASRLACSSASFSIRSISANRQVGGQLGVGDEGHRRDPFAVVDLMLDQAAGGAGGVELGFAEAQLRVLRVIPAVGGAVAIAELCALLGVADHLADRNRAGIDQRRRVAEAPFGGRDQELAELVEEVAAA